MQVKPRFETYKILQQFPFLRDDSGNEICLTLLEVRLPSDESEIMETTYKYWTVIGKNQVQWNNKAVSYESVAYWKVKKKDKLFKEIVEGFLIEEIELGHHYVFTTNIPPKEEDFGLRTTFKIARKN